MTISHYISLMDTMARMALKAEANRYYLGYLWWVLEPLLWVGVFYFVFYVLLGSGAPGFLLFLAVGKLFFIWFSKTVNYAGNSLTNNAGLIGRMALPKTVFPLAVVVECGYRQMAVLGVLLVILLINGVSPQLHWLWLIPIIAVQLLLIVLCSCVAALLVAFKRDFALLINLGMIFLLFVSGIFWDIRDIVSERAMDMLLIWNPMAFLLHCYRQVLLWQELPNLTHLIALGVLLSVLLATVVAFMVRYSAYIARRVVTQ
jgi:lipopolysaccharide transport system permease protein